MGDDAVIVAAGGPVDAPRYVVGLTESEMVELLHLLLDHDVEDEEASEEILERIAARLRKKLKGLRQGRRNGLP
jgi:hypothetical protein